MGIDYEPRKVGEPSVTEAVSDAERHRSKDSAETVRVRARNALAIGIERSRYKASIFIILQQI